MENWTEKFSHKIRKLFLEAALMKDINAMDSRENLEERLQMVAQESQVVPDGESGSEIQYRPTMRAFLALKGYLLKRKLGTGSYSKVYKALSNGKFADEVAVKIVDRSTVKPSYLTKFLPVELHIWPQLQHKNLIQLYEVLEYGSRLFMICELAQNGTMLRYIQDRGKVGEVHSRHWMQEICSAVSYLHGRGLAHRDLKLENILLDVDYSIKLTDFGFIKSTHGNQLSKTYCGSKAYAAPELIQGIPYSPRKVDSWALGVILYIMLSGLMPFDEAGGTKAMHTEQQNIKQRIQGLKELSQECTDLLMGLFEWDPKLRLNIHQIIAHPWLST